MGDPLRNLELMVGFSSGPWQAIVRRARPLVLGGTALCLLTGAGLAHGARLAIGTAGVWALAEPAVAGALTGVPASVGRGRVERDPLRGDFWVPEGSTAERPKPGLQRRVWRPER